MSTGAPQSVLKALKDQIGRVIENPHRAKERELGTCTVGKRKVKGSVFAPLSPTNCSYYKRKKTLSDLCAPSGAVSFVCLFVCSFVCLFACFII